MHSASQNLPNSSTAATLSAPSATTPAAMQPHLDGAVNGSVAAANGGGGAPVSVTMLASRSPGPVALPQVRGAVQFFIFVSVSVSVFRFCFVFRDLPVCCFVVVLLIVCFAGCLLSCLFACLLSIVCLFVRLCFVDAIQDIRFFVYVFFSRFSGFFFLHHTLLL